MFLYKSFILLSRLQGHANILTLFLTREMASGDPLVVGAVGAPWIAPLWVPGSALWLPGTA